MGATGHWEDALRYSCGGSISGRMRTRFKLQVGKRMLVVEKEANVNGEIEITAEDIAKAKIDYIRGAKINIITRTAERKAEDLLKMFISEMDFRDYKQKGYFLVKSGDKLFKIYKDNHKMVDMWERRKGGLFVPQNRLCVHTQNRELPLADEVLSKLMLIKSNRIFDRSNLYSVISMENVKEKDLVLV